MKKIITLIAALALICSLCSCGSGESSQTETTEAQTTAIDVTMTPSKSSDDEVTGDDRIYGEWSGPQVTTQGQTLAQVEMKFTKDGKFTYLAKGDYNGDEVEIKQDGTFTIDVDVVSMTFKNSVMKNLKTGKETKEKISEDDYQSVNGTLTSSTDLTIMSDYGYSINLKKK